MQTVHSWAVQNEMRGVLGWVSAGVAEQLLDSANPRRYTNLMEGCFRCSIDEREHSERDEEAQVPWWKSCVKPVCQRFSIRQYTPSLRRVNTRDKRRETTRDCRGHK